MTNSTKMIVTGVMLVAILIAGWAFFRDQRLKNLAPAATGDPISVTESRSAEVTNSADSEIDADLQSIDMDLKQLDEDNTNIDDTMDQPANENNTLLSK